MDNLNELKVFMFCNDFIPTQCVCGCGCTKDFTNEKQSKSFEVREKFRFFKNVTHIKRMRKLGF